MHEKLSFKVFLLNVLRKLNVLVERVHLLDKNNVLQCLIFMVLLYGGLNHGSFYFHIFLCVLVNFYFYSQLARFCLQCGGAVRNVSFGKEKEAYLIIINFGFLFYRGQWVIRVYVDAFYFIIWLFVTFVRVIVCIKRNIEITVLELHSTIAYNIFLKFLLYVLCDFF